MRREPPAFQVLLTKTEAEYVQNALDMYSRLQMGQAWIIADYVDPEQNDVDGRLAFKEKLQEVQALITGDARPGVSRYPTERNLQRGELVRDLFEHLRYARTHDRYASPLRYDPQKVREVQAD